MAYVQIARTPGRTLADFEAVNSLVNADGTPGHIALIAGEVDGTLHIVDVWESKAECDRFVAERLIPAFEKTGLGPGPDSTFVAFTTDQIVMHGAPSRA